MVVNPTLPDLNVLRRCWPEYADPASTRAVTVHGVAIGGPARQVIAGPCAVESFEQTLAIAEAVHKAGARLLRGGAFKPRTNPHSFQGLGREGLEILAEVLHPDEFSYGHEGTGWVRYDRERRH